MRLFSALCALPLLCCLAFDAHAAAPRLSLDAKAGNQVLLTKDGKQQRLPKDVGEAMPVDNAKLFWFAFNAEDSAKEYGAPIGLYIFDESGTQKVFAPLEYAEMVGGAVLSPKGTVLAVDWGGALVRDWSFFSFPEMKLLGGESAGYLMVEDKPALIWLDDTDVLYNTMDTDSKRECGYDPCGPVSVMRHNVTTGKTTPVLQGTMLCDYTMKSFADGVVTAEKLCLKSAGEWKTYPENKPRETVTVKLP